jgi:hypothetical protein
MFYTLLAFARSGYFRFEVLLHFASPRASLHPVFGPGPVFESDTV